MLFQLLLGAVVVTGYSDIARHHGGEPRHVLEGVALPPEKTLTSPDSNEASHSPHRLHFNGAGVRSIRMFGWDFKVYVAGFYTSLPLETPESVFKALESNNSLTPMQLDFTFLRSVNQGRVTDAWKQQTEHSVEFTYPGYDEDRAFFIDCFGPIENGGTETVQLLPNGKTVVIDQGVQKCVIDGLDFQRAFLSMWFGSKAVSMDLKAGLLGSVHRFGLQPHRRNIEDRDVNMLGEYTESESQQG
jgi:Chalcone isomerase-like